MGKTWTTVDGEPLTTPVSPEMTLVRDYSSKKQLVYLKDINFDHDGNPIILHITSAHHNPGPQTQPRSWMIAHWNGEFWQFHRVTDAWHNYDMGSLYVEPDGTWRIIAPTEKGPQEWATGGENAVWESSNKGASWKKTKVLTKGSRRNHTYVRRPVNALESFYAFWRDGDPLKQSPSRLYFADKAGMVWMLPERMAGESASPMPYEQ